jgi:hypothetical protein
MTGFDRKVLHLKTDKPAPVDIEVDFLGAGPWEKYASIRTGATGYAYHVFPAGFSAHWVRLTPHVPCVATAEFLYT